MQGLAAALGNMAAHQLPGALSPLWYVPLALIGLLGLRWPCRWTLISALAGFAVTAAAIDARLDERLPPTLTGKDLAVTGWVDTFPRVTPERTTFSLRVLSSDEPQMPRRLRLNWYDAPFEIAPGDALALVVRVRRPRGLANPGGFDYERWALIEQYGATGYVRRGESIHAEAGIAQWWLRVRYALAERITEVMATQDAAALVIALALGERYLFDVRHWETLRNTGTSHLFSISGLHVGMVAALTFVVVRRFWLRLPAPLAGHDLEAAGIAGFLLATLYAALAGFTVPTQRALIMLAVAMAALVGRRGLRFGAGLVTALVLVLAWDPFASLTVSFWLSFVAVAVLLVAASPRSLDPPGWWRSRFVSGTRSLVSLQWAVTVGLAPLTVLYFGGLPLLSPVVNLLAVPLFSLLVVPAALSSALMLLALGDDRLGAVAWIGARMEQGWMALEEVAAWEWAVVSLPQPAPWAMALALLGGFAALRVHPLPARWLAWLPLAALLQGYGERPPPGGLRATVLDVGHGLAVLIETHDHALLYDAGPRYGAHFDSGTQIVLPAMRALGIGALDTLVVSHPDADHSGGAAAVLAAHPQARVMGGGGVDLPGVQRCRAGQQWTWDAVHFSVLHPEGDGGGAGNDGSCVLRIGASAGVLLLTGDIERSAETRLLRHGHALAADVVTVPHHGSATSSSLAFVHAVGADLAIVSAGFEHRWGFPKPEVRARWGEAGAGMLVTGEYGAVTIDFDPNRGITVTAQRARSRRYWFAKSPPLPGESLDGAL